MSAKLEKVIVRMPPEMHRAIKERAAEEERSMAQTIRRAVRWYLAVAPEAWASAAEHREAKEGR